MATPSTGSYQYETSDAPGGSELIYYPPGMTPDPSKKASFTTDPNSASFLSQYAGGSPGTPNLPVGSVGPTSKLGITDPVGSADLSGSMIAGASQFVKSYTDSLNAIPKTDTAKTADQINTDLSTLEGQDTGRGAAQLQAEADQGLPGSKKQLADINAQILSKVASYNQLSVANDNKAISMNSIIGNEAQIKKAQASEVGMLQAVALGLQGQVTAAQDAADRSVDLKYQDIEDQIKAKQAQLQLLQPRLTAEEKTKSDALDMYYKQQQDKIDQEKSDAKTFQTSKIQGLTNGMPAVLAQYAQSLYDQGNTDQAYAVMHGYTGSASNEDGSGGNTFSKTQLNKGAAVGDMSLSDFNSLDADTQNFYINRAPDIAAQKKEIDDAFLAGDDPRVLEGQIAGFDIPEAVKDTLTRYLKQKFADQYAIFGDNPSSSNAAPTKKPWWQGLIGLNTMGLNK